MIRQLLLLRQSITDPNRDVIWFDGKEMGYLITIAYYKNAKGEAANMLHWMSS